MAVNKIAYSSSLVMELEAGVNKSGAKVYKKKTFSGVKTDAPIESIFAVAQALTTVLEKQAGSFYLAESSIIVSE